MLFSVALDPIVEGHNIIIFTKLPEMTIKIIKTNEYNKLFPAIREYYNNIIIILGLYEWYKRNKYNKNMNKIEIY